MIKSHCIDPFSNSKPNFDSIVRETMVYIFATHQFKWISYNPLLAARVIGVVGCFSEALKVNHSTKDGLF